MSISAMIRTERETLGLSMRDLAALAGVSYPTISRIENGHEDPRWDTLTKIAAALGKTLAPTFETRPILRLADIDVDGATGEPDWTRLR
ncbi:MAG: helix-turn-helix transcriptional regulator, partial [Ilumatobacter sp.]|nr:helix-turn-helix transcriptional regulator [Ilumatobacter sp.]